MLSSPSNRSTPTTLRCWVCLLLALLGTALLLKVRSTAAAEPAAISEIPLSDDDRDHWAYLPVRSPALPLLDEQRQQACRSGIDYFIQSRLAGRDLALAAAADRSTLIRRLSLDLLGLPPTPSEIDNFLADRRPAAYGRLVDRLLASPHCGERLAQQWLDLARFAETDGFEHDNIRKDAWQYRDWVIAAINRDMPYDQFIALQIAGDELQPGDADARIATMFCLSGPDMPDINSQLERRHSLLNEITSTVGSVVLGLQLECAQCHDHKYDPISQADFYRLRAVFEPAVSVVKNKSLSVLHETAGKLPANHLFERGDYRRPGAVLEPAFPRIANPQALSLQPAEAGSPSSGRRSQLATWLRDPSHPLTSRVIANRIWQHHFGRGLAETPSDFGLMGQPPTHPRLLDYLATELVRSGWSMKHLHRLIVSSACYRQQSRFELVDGQALDWQRAMQADPDNTWLWRFPRQRLQGEIVRDSMLSAAGVLNSAQGGPGIRPPLSAELVNTLRKGQWEVTPALDQHDRRSVYVFARRNLRYPIFDAFDRPDANASCAMRASSTTAPQGLLLLNSEFSLQTARRLAGRILQQVESQNDFVEALFLSTLSRPPTESERNDCLQFLQHQTQLEMDEPRELSQLALPIPAAEGLAPARAAAASLLCLAIFNINEFLYID